MGLVYRQVQKEKEKPGFQESIARTWFERYRDEEETNMITPEGTQKFFEDIGVSLESTTLLIHVFLTTLGNADYHWLENASKQDGVDSINKFKDLLPSLQESVKEDEMFKKMYLFCFGFSKTTGQKSMDVETAIALWEILLQEKYPHVGQFLEFLQEVKPVKVINKDQWTNLLEFVKTVPVDLSTYDDSSSWPVLLDDYVAWKRGK
ncbi:Cullin binding-domain-containing protein [Phycomyces nitens]|nr:Cullin binding-domain-containing protein [Phycomyces nitens]